MKNEKEVILFPYILTSDTGFAPNPYGDICTLVTCKPGIRKKAKVGDWVIGVYSKNIKKHGGIHRGNLVYAMEVTGKMCLRCYDKYCERLKIKIPPCGKTLPSKNYPKQCVCDETCKEDTAKIKSVKEKNINEQEKENIKSAGDCFLEFGVRGKPKLRKYQHLNAPDLIKRDIDGQFALLSTNYFYLGANGSREHKNLLGKGLKKDLKFIFDRDIKQRSYHNITLSTDKVGCLKKWVKKVKTRNPIKPIDKGKIFKNGKKTIRQIKEGSSCHGC